MVQCAEREGGKDAGVLRERSADDGLSQWAGHGGQQLGEVECGVSVADGGGVGEGGAERGERTAFSVGQHHFVESSELLRFSRRLRLGRESNERLSPDVRRERLSLHQSGGIFRAERVWGLRHGWEHTAVVLGLLWGIFERFADRPAWPHFRPGPYYSGRRLGRRRVLLPDGGPRQLRRGERGGLRLRIPVRPAPRSVS